MRVALVLKLIISIGIVVLVDLRELLQEKAKVKVMSIYFTVIGICLTIGILMCINKIPVSPLVKFMNWTKSLGLKEG